MGFGGKDCLHKRNGYSLWPRPAGLRIAVAGGGCSGFSYSMTFENSRGMLDKTYNSGGFEVLSGNQLTHNPYVTHSQKPKQRIGLHPDSYPRRGRSKQFPRFGVRPRPPGSGWDRNWLADSASDFQP